MAVGRNPTVNMISKPQEINAYPVIRDARQLRMVQIVVDPVQSACIIKKYGYGIVSEGPSY